MKENKMSANYFLKTPLKFFLLSEAEWKAMRKVKFTLYLV